MYNPSYNSGPSYDDSTQSYSNGGRSSSDNSRTSYDNGHQQSSDDNGDYQSSDDNGHHHHHHHPHHHPHHHSHHHPHHRSPVQHSTHRIEQVQSANKAQSKHASGNSLTRNTQSVNSKHGTDSYHNAFKTSHGAVANSHIITTNKRHSAASSVINSSNYAGVSRQNARHKDNKDYNSNIRLYSDGGSQSLNVLHSKSSQGAKMTAVETKSYRGATAQKHANSKSKHYVHSESNGPGNYGRSETNALTTKNQRAAKTAQVSTRSYQGQNGQQEANAELNRFFHNHGINTAGTKHSLYNTHRQASHQATVNSVVLTPGVQTAHAGSENTQTASKYFRNRTETASGAQNSKLIAETQAGTHAVATAKTINSNSAEQNAQEHNVLINTVYQSGGHN